MTYRRTTYRSTTGPAPLVTPRQSAALDKMAAANGFASGSMLLADVASTTMEELGRQPRSVVQMFVSHAFERYGRDSAPREDSARRARNGHRYGGGYGRCEDAPCCGCCD